MANHEPLIYEVWYIPELDEACLLLNYDMRAQSFKIMVPGPSFGTAALSYLRARGEYIGDIADNLNKFLVSAKEVSRVGRNP